MLLLLLLLHIFHLCSSSLVERHGIPFNAPILQQNLLQFITTRAPLRTKVRAQHPFALSTLSNSTDLPQFFTNIQDINSMGNMFIQSPASLEHGAQQIEYLVLEKKVLPLDFLSIAQAYRTTYQEMTTLDDEPGSMFVPAQEQLEKQFYLFNTMLYYPDQEEELASLLTLHQRHGKKSTMQEKPLHFWEDVQRR